MIEVYIPFNRSIFNRNSTIIDGQKQVLYQHKISWFYSELSLYQDQHLIYVAYRRMSLKTIYDIKHLDEIICSVKISNFPFSLRHEIETRIGNYEVKGKPYRSLFEIIHQNQTVLSIKEDVNLVNYRIILVDESNIGFLLMLMFVLITAEYKDRRHTFIDF